MGSSPSIGSIKYKDVAQWIRASASTEMVVGWNCQIYLDIRILSFLQKNKTMNNVLLYSDSNQNFPNIKNNYVILRQVLFEQKKLKHIAFS